MPAERRYNVVFPDGDLEVTLACTPTDTYDEIAFSVAYTGKSIFIQSRLEGEKHPIQFISEKGIKKQRLNYEGRKVVIRF